MEGEGYGKERETAMSNWLSTRIAMGKWSLTKIAMSSCLLTKTARGKGKEWESVTSN